jgi:hypothetical protein
VDIFWLCSQIESNSFQSFFSMGGEINNEASLAVEWKIIFKKYIGGDGPGGPSCAGVRASFDLHAPNASVLLDPRAIGSRCSHF